MYYSYELWKDDKKIIDGKIFAYSEKQAIQEAYYQNKKKYEIRNVKPIK